MSPRSAEIGTKRMSAMSRLAAKARYSSRMRLNTDSSKSSRSILLMATTTCLMPSRLTM
ncbi:hypothetical protein D3C72_2557050 [compost metagenome]